MSAGEGLGKMLKIVAILQMSGIFLVKTLLLDKETNNEIEAKIISMGS